MADSFTRNTSLTRLVQYPLKRSLLILEILVQKKLAIINVRFNLTEIMKFAKQSPEREVIAVIKKD